MRQPLSEVMPQCLLVAFLALSCASPTHSLRDSARRVVLYVDPCKDALTEVCAVQEALERHGTQVMPLWSEAMADELVSGESGDVQAKQRWPSFFSDSMQRAPAEGEELSWAAQHLDGLQLEAVLCGSDGGLSCAERLQHVLIPARSNGIVPARRDKFEMNERCRAAGLAVVEQAAPSSWEMAEGFLRERLRLSDEPSNTAAAVIKPRRGQASVGVRVARSLAEAETLFGVLSRSLVSIDTSEGSIGRAGVVQALLDGDEWIVDVVSRDGVHKVVALWRYDKGAANGAPFVYYSAKLCAAGGQEESEVMDYACAALDALAWRWGPGHIEVRMTSAGPRLIEVNVGRWNGLDFKLVCDLGVGYNAFDATLDAYLLPTAEGFDKLPVRPPHALICHGRLVTLVSYVEGTIKRVRHTDLLNQMTSLVTFEPTVTEGEGIHFTVDLDTCVGHAHLIHRDAEVVEADYTKLRALQQSLFEVQKG